jgi:glucosamine-6-phosphate deaminase
MTIDISPHKQELGRRAAERGAQAIRDAVAANDRAHIIVATGASQFEMLEHLVGAPDINWSKVTAFHLDEYVGLPLEHPASFRKYLQERFIARLPQPIGAFHPISGEGDAQAECKRLEELIARAPIDVAFVGIGENGHLAFNDPPADFQIEVAYLVVDLDEACRRQQMGEGWFQTLEEVPRQAISMSIQQILKSQTIIASVPDERKATAVRDCLSGPVSPHAPASILQNHAATYIYLDSASASLLP